MALRFVEARDVMAMFGDGRELALLDVREELPFSEAHLLHARSVPLSRLELRIGALVPRRNTRVVLCDANDGLSERAAAVLESMGYSQVALLNGGIAAWERAGFLLFSGVNVPSKAFGEHVEHGSLTPSVSAQELHQMIEEGADIVVLDSRPYDEYSRISIPTATNMPGAELVLRVRDAAPSPDTTVIVNCAGRTRSIIGAQSLIDAGVPNKVFALRNGTMGWSLAGFSCDTGKTKTPLRLSPEALAWAKSAVTRVAERFDIQHVDMATVRAWQVEADRTLYLLDVRDPSDYAAGHVAGAQSAPGGQLVQATDQYVGVLNARIVLVDDLAVRAVMTASWLTRMGLPNVYVLVASGDVQGRDLPVVPEIFLTPGSALDAATLGVMLKRDEATVIDLSLSREFRKEHIPGAWFAIRSQLWLAFGAIALKGVPILTSEDGVLAALAVKETMQYLGRPVRHLAGGNAAWREAGCAFESGEGRMASAALDVWLKPYERATAISEAMSQYLSWEVDLLPRIAQDGTCRFAHR
jgi:rhodanese-related sulfurtransferase